MQANLADTRAGASQAAVSSLPASSPLSDADRHRSDQRPHSAELLVLGSEVQTPDRAISTAQSTSGKQANIMVWCGTGSCSSQGPLLLAVWQLCPVQPLAATVAIKYVLSIRVGDTTDGVSWTCFCRADS